MKKSASPNDLTVAAGRIEAIVFTAVHSEAERGRYWRRRTCVRCRPEILSCAACTKCWRTAIWPRPLEQPTSIETRVVAVLEQDLPKSAA